jgi:hypothetical protein
MNLKDIYYCIGGIFLLISAGFSTDWSISITGQDIYDLGSSHTIHLGVCQSCSDGWQFGEDQYDYPDPFSGEYTNIHFFHLDWFGTVDDAGNTCCDDMAFSTDYRAIHSNSVLVGWGIRGSTGGGMSPSVPLSLSWDIAAFDTLSADYEVYLYIGDTGYNMRTTSSATANQSDFYLDEEYRPNIWVYMGACASTGTTTHYLDEDNDGWGGEVEADFCLGFAPEGWVPNNEDMDDTHYCTSNLIDDCEVCDGYDLDKDCNGDCFGSAFIDDCSMCSEGNSGHTANSDKDCLGDCFGSAFLDDCSMCSEGNSGHTANSDQDCAGVCFGNAIIDDCDECVNNNYNAGCIDDILGNGPNNVYAQIFEYYINITWDIPDGTMNDLISHYSVYYEENSGTQTHIGNTTNLSFTLSSYMEGIFCVSASDQYGNESSRNCVEATADCTFSWVLDPGPNLISIPCLPEDNSIGNIVNGLEGQITGVIAGGAAAQYIEGIGFIGALLELDQHSGYWFLIDPELEEPVSYSLSGQPARDISYSFNSPGIKLISYQGDDNTPLSYALPDDIEPYIPNIIGEGNAATQINGNWYGSLTHWNIGRGYWMTSNAALTFTWEEGFSRNNDNIYDGEISSKLPELFHYYQSTKQAFYFVEDILLSNGNTAKDGYLLSYIGESLTGARHWRGEMADIPVMGKDITPYTEGYAQIGDIPRIVYYDVVSGDYIDLSAEFTPKWKENGVYNLGFLSEAELQPESMSISAYPNPFNPKTAIQYAVDMEGLTSISIINSRGQVISTLVSSIQPPGIYSIEWDAAQYPSGLYFARLETGDKVLTRKLVFLK